MRKNRFSNVLMGLLLALLALSSCGSKKEIVYLQDMKPGGHYPFEMKHEAIVHHDDRLSIVVSCKQPELALPFNVQNSVIQVSADGTVNADGSAAPREKGYRVDSNGNINFPILGTLHVEGMTVAQVQDLVRSKIIEGNYVNDPLVAVEFINFKYTVLGAVGGNGTYSVEGDRITLLEAIAKAGDVAPNGNIKNVLVIREVGGERQVFTHDLRSKSLFDSPAFYLQQNDIVYVEPRYRKKDKTDTIWQYFTGVMSIITAACSLLWATK